MKRLLVSADDALGHGETVVFGHKSEVYLPLLERIRPDQTVFDLAGICGPDDIAGHYEGVYW